jgi:uncharacterized RDD family membrane protein YckC
MLDTRRDLETPEGVELGLSMAGLPSRMMAAALDQVLRLMVYSTASVALGFLGDVGLGLLLITMFVGEWFYPVFFEVLWNGATPGKKALGLVVLHDDGTPVSWSASVVRNLMRTVDFLPLFYGFGIVAVVLSRDFKRLGDLAAGTVVVYRDSVPRAAKLAAAKPVPLPVPLSSGEQRAIVDFAERLVTWSPERARELASLASPLTGTAGEPAVESLSGMASWIVGRR